MKKKFLLLSLGLAVLAATYAFADTIDLSAYVYFPKVTIAHTPITSVSPETRVLKAKASVDFATYIAATAKILYYKNDESSTIYSEPESELTIQNKTDFYITLPKMEESVNAIHYRIRVTARNNSGNVDEIFFPEMGDSTDPIYITANISSSSTAEVDSSSGGTIVLDDGNQETGSTSVTFEPGSVDGSGSVIIEEISIDDFFSSFFPVTAFAHSSAVKVSKSIAKSDIDKTKFVKGYKVSSIGSITINTYGYAEFSYGAETAATKFDLLFSPLSDGNTFDYIPIKKVDTERRVVVCELKDFGYYFIMLSSNLSDNDYRPAKRVRIKARIANGTYEGFRFGNLKEGDSVKIYNLNGKKVAELVAGDKNGFVWKGRKGTDNNGDWAESGTYVYQIKLNESGKIISGTIAFVW